MADVTGFSRPTLQDLITRNEAEINSRLDGADSRLRRSVLSVIARIVAGATHGLYGFLAFIIKQVFADTAEDAYLLRLAAVFGVTPEDSVQSFGPTPITGTNGVTIPAGTLVQRGDGVEFATTGAVTISGGSVSANWQAVNPGVAGNTVSGTILTFISPISGVDATVVCGGFTGGADTESTDSVRTRYLKRLQQPPQGGATSDYPEWALEVPNVTRAWVYPKESGKGSVTVRFMMDNIYGNGIPASGDVTTVQNYIDGVRPTTAEFFAYAPTPETLNFSIRLIDQDGNTVTDPTVQSAVQASLQDFIQREATPKADGVVNTAPTGKLLFSRIRQAISNAAGEYDHNITVPSGDVTPSNTGDIYVMGTITWLP